MARILFILSNLEAVGGTERMVLGLANMLAEKHQVHVCCFSIADRKAPGPNAYRMHVLGMPRERPLALRWLTYAEQARRLRDLKRAIQPDVSISNLWRADLVNVLSGTAEPKIAVLHISVTARANRLLRRFRWVATRIYRKFGAVVAVSPGVAKEAHSFNRVPRDRVFFIPNSVQVPATPFLKKTYDALWCGRFVDEKNPIGAVAVFRDLLTMQPYLRIAMIGDGPLHGAAIEEAGSLAGKAVEPGRIAFLGAVQMAWPEIGKSRLFVLTSVTEGLPLVMLEAMTQGVPIAAADCGGEGPHELLGSTSAHDPHRQVTEMTASGVLLPIPIVGSSSIELWVDTLANLLSDTKLVAELGEGASERARRYSPDSTRKAWEKLIDEVAS